MKEPAITWVRVETLVPKLHADILQVAARKTNQPVSALVARMISVCLQELLREEGAQDASQNTENNQSSASADNIEPVSTAPDVVEPTCDDSGSPSSL